MTERSLYMKIENKFLKVREWIKTELQKSAIGRVIFRHYQKREMFALSELPGILKNVFILLAISAIGFGLSYLVQNMIVANIGLTLELILTIGAGISLVLAVVISLFYMPLCLIDDFFASALFN